jgi:hypothetical protein
MSAMGASAVVRRSWRPTGSIINLILRDENACDNAGEGGRLWSIMRRGVYDSLRQHQVRIFSTKARLIITEIRKPIITATAQ